MKLNEDGHRLADTFLRLATATACGAFAFSAVSHWLENPARITLLLLMIANCFTTGLSLFTRTPARRDWRPIALLCSLGGSYTCIFYNLNPGVKIVSEGIGALLQICGIACQLFAKASLRRSFGVLPANRGVVSRGPYRFVRHPMYLGYFVTDLGLFLTNFSIYNLALHLIQVLCQVGRIMQEERVLSADSHYRSYSGSVRYRLIPMVF